MPSIAIIPQKIHIIAKIRKTKQNTHHHVKKQNFKNLSLLGTNYITSLLIILIKKEIIPPAASLKERKYNPKQN